MMKDETKYYFPSNGTEGMSFIATWCEKCRKDPAMRNAESNTYCSILTRSMTECKRVKQWVYINGVATCTSFVHYQSKRQPKKSKSKPNQLKLIL